MVITMEPQIVESTNPAVSELRSRLTSNKTSSKLDPRIVNSDPFLSRYLHFNGENVEKAERMLQLYAEYHEEHKCDQRSTITFPAQMVQDFSLQLGGRDVHNRPLTMIPDASNWNIKKYVELGQGDTLLQFIMDMRLRTVETCLERNVDSGVVIVNVENFQYTQYFHKKSLMFVVNVLQLMEKLAPGEINGIFFINAPRILKFICETMQKFVKINLNLQIFDASDKKWKEKLRQHFPEDGIIPEFGGTLEKIP